MRNRILQKSFWTSSGIIELEIHERLLFLGMTNHADDDGIIKTAPRALKAKIFPADDIPIEAVEFGLEKMNELGLIIFNEDRSLCRFVNWKDHQKINRPYPSKFKFVEEKKEHSMSIHGTFNEHSLPNNNNNSNNKKKKKKNNNNKTNKSVFSNEFESFWKQYPRTIAKKKCGEKFNQLLKDFQLEEIMMGTEMWLEYWEAARIEKKYIPHPYTFLSQERFIDVPEKLQEDFGVEYRLDTTGNFFVGFCGDCGASGFYRKDELSQDSKCCKNKILPQRDMIKIQEVNAKA